MDIEAIAGMIFVLLIIMMVGGGILLYPLVQRLGALLEQRLQEKQVKGIDPAEFAELRRAVRALQAEVARIAEQQAFTESLLQARDQPLLPSDGEQLARRNREAAQLPERPA